MRRLLASLLVLAYLFALVMSTGHLSEWYRLTLGTLPTWFAIGLAGALEASAFLLSLLSNSLLRGSAWAAWGSLIALGLVWVGNFFSMMRAGEATGIPTYEVFLASLFVPVSTYVVAKVLGELLEKDVKTAPVYAIETEVNPEPTPVYSGLEEAPSPSPSPSPEVNPGFTENPKEPERSFRRSGEVYLRLLREPKTAKELMEHLGVSKAAVYKQLRALEAKGLVVNREGKWQAVDGGVKA
jgi:DNA-binding transcriptional ArsR family regulator